MVTYIKAKEFLVQYTELTVLDVRSPSEYHQGHVPGALSFPLFNDEERADVGKRYKQSGRIDAVMLGLDIVGPRLSAYLRKAKKLIKGNVVLMYCWRGGMRSESLAWLLSKAGIDVRLLEGGYKAYRRHIRQAFEAEKKILILGGMTGSGKTDILSLLADKGHQVIDLEGVACHKGSSFGAIGQEEQPTNEQFENNIYEHWRKIHPGQVLWLEDESRSIGKVGIPEPLFQQMRRARVIEVVVDRECRLKRLLKDYTVTSTLDLIEASKRLRKRLGDKNTKIIVDLIEEEKLEAAAECLLDYYDKAYRNTMKRRPEGAIIPLQLNNCDIQTHMKQIISFAEKHRNDLNIDNKLRL